MKSFEWAIIGSGISGISVAEILAREGHSVVLIEKNNKLASETTREFHEWIHTGALYTLIPDKLITLRFILGAIDDLIEYYSNFSRMNLVPSSSGLIIEEREDGGWFSPNYINFQYRIRGRKVTFPWIIGVARSLFINDKLHHHDWLRRRAGELGPIKQQLYSGIIKNFGKLISYNEKFYNYKTTDFTTNSRILLRDLVTTAIKNGMEVSLQNRIDKIENINNKHVVCGDRESFKVNKIAVCAGAGIRKFVKASVNTSYAPIAVVDNINKGAESFVQLDYFPKKCINLLTKGDGVGLIGGITLNNLEKCNDYINFVIKEHKINNPNMRVVTKYIGKKNEIIMNKQERNYLYHINAVNNKKNIWSIIPGKFTLGFSLAPEFYRRVYNKNPQKTFISHADNGEYSELVSNTSWYDAIFNNNKG